MAQSSTMVSARRALLLAAVVLSACQDSGERTTLSMSLGSTKQLITVGGARISRFAMRVDCLDGRVETVTGTIDDQGHFDLEAPRCFRAALTFQGLVVDGSPALQGDTEVFIRPPVTLVDMTVVHVGTLTILNEDPNATVCVITSNVDPSVGKFGKRFQLAQGESTSAVVPVDGTELTCIPLQSCSDPATCVIDRADPLATHNGVSPPFGGTVTLALNDLTRALRFVSQPMPAQTAGVAWQSFAVEVVDRLGNVATTQNSGSATLRTTSASANGGFGGETAPITAGIAVFDGAFFRTAGPLDLVVTADINGVRLSTPPLQLTVAPGVAADLVLQVPPGVTAGVPFNVSVSGTDEFSNNTGVPIPLIITSDDPRARALRFDDATTPLTFTLFTAGNQTITASDILHPEATASAPTAVSAGAGSVIGLEAPGVVSSGDQFSATVVVRDSWDNIASGYGGRAIGLSAGGSFSGATSYTFNGTENGTHVYTPLSFASASGTFSITASDGTLIDGSATVRVAASGAPTGYSFALNPSSPVAGQQTSVTITAYTSSGVVASTYFNNVNLDASGETSTIYPYVSAGVASTTYTFYSAGTQHFELNDFVATHNSQDFNVIAAPAYAYQFTSQPPANVLAGSPFSIALQVRDAYGNAIPATTHNVTLTLNGAGTLSGATETKLGTTHYFNNLVVNGSGAFTLTPTFAPQVPFGSASNTFTVTSPRCGTAYVSKRGAAGNSGCSEGSPVDTITRALEVVDRGGKIHVTQGTYSETVSALKETTVTIVGGFDDSFKSTRPFQQPTIIHGAEDAVQAVLCAESSELTLDGLIVLGPVVTKPSSAAHYGIYATDGCTLHVYNSRVEGPYSEIDFPVSAIAISDAKSAVLANNWIHPGKLSRGITRYSNFGVYVSGSSSAAVINNTLYVPIYAERNPVGAAFHYVGNGEGLVTVTNNLIFGDFSVCASGRGACSVIEPGQYVDSVQNNVFIDTNGKGASGYLLGTSVIDNVNERGAPGFTANRNVSVSPSTLFVSLAGADRNIDTLEDNNWHITNVKDVRTGKDPRASTCGSSGKEPCNGLPIDIDGETRSVPTCQGADELR